MLLRSWRRLRRRFHIGLRDETRKRSKSSAMVFAPHQDDETLGCGGTVILKTRAGAPVSFVFMTDGVTSHRRFMREEELRLLRKTEASNAAAVLGLAPENVHFLDFPDGKLKRFHAEAVAKVVLLMNLYRPEEVYVPYRFDGTTDHESTHAVVIEAAKIFGRSVEICEYPVWFWNQWPWVPMKLNYDRNSARELLKVLWDCLILRRFKEFRSGVFVMDVLEKKRQALDQHRSQMTVLESGTSWPTLADISDGEFLRCFFQEYEVFRCSILPAPGGGHSR